MEIHQSIPIKIILLGSLNVGKTSLLTKYDEGKNQRKTLNASYVNISKIINGITFELRIWDTAGQEKYKSLTKLFLKEAKIAILVYSIDNIESFNDLDEWLNLVKNTNDDIIYGVAANKSDLSSEQKVPDEKGKEYANSIGAEWRATSAITEGKGIDNFINDLLLKYYNTYFKLGHGYPSISLTSSIETSLPQPKNKSCCSGDNNNNARNNTEIIK